MSIRWYRRRPESADCDDNTVGKPRHGDRDVVTAEQIGRDRARKTVLASHAPSSEPVKQLITHTHPWNLVIARKFVRDPRNPEGVVARAIGWTATGPTEPGDLIASTHVARIGAVVNGEQMNSLRHAANCVIRTEGEATEMFAFVGARHWLEAAALRWAEFEDVSDHKVSARTLTDVRDWMRGEPLLWLKLESLVAKRAAAELRDKLEGIRTVEDLIERARSAGIEPDERVIHRRQELQLGLGNRWIFVGARLVTEVDREPSVRAFEAANGRKG